MSETVTVYGASDDLIQIEGDLREEWCTDASDETRYVAFGDGTVLSVWYDGFWRINRVATGRASYEKREATDEDTDYSDRVTLAGDLMWVICGAKGDFHRVGKGAARV